MPTLKRDWDGDPYLLENDGETFYVYYYREMNSFHLTGGSLQGKEMWANDRSLRLWEIPALHRDRMVWLQELMRCQS